MIAFYKIWNTIAIFDYIKNKMAIFIPYYTLYTFLAYLRTLQILLQIMCKSTSGGGEVTMQESVPPYCLFLAKAKFCNQTLN